MGTCQICDKTDFFVGTGQQDDAQDEEWFEGGLGRHGIPYLSCGFLFIREIMGDTLVPVFDLVYTELVNDTRTELCGCCCHPQARPYA